MFFVLTFIELESIFDIRKGRHIIGTMSDGDTDIHSPAGEITIITVDHHEVDHREDWHGYSSDENETSTWKKLRFLVWGTIFLAGLFAASLFII